MPKGIIFGEKQKLPDFQFNHFSSYSGIYKNGFVLEEVAIKLVCSVIHYTAP